MNKICMYCKRNIRQKTYGQLYKGNDILYYHFYCWTNAKKKERQMKEMEEMKKNDQNT